MDYFGLDTGYEHVKVCRVCLNMDVKLLDLQTEPLDTYFEAIIGIPVISTMDLPPYICYECAGYVKKFYFFKDRCLRGQTVLYGISQAAGKVSIEELKQIDREALKVKSSLSIRDTSVYLSIEHDDDVVFTDTIQVKQEPVIISENGIGLSVELESVKEEVDFQDDFFTNYSSDDEPLSIHKTNKDKKKGKKKSKKNKVQEDFIGIHIEEESELTRELNDLEPIPKRRKRGRPRHKIKANHSIKLTKETKARRTKNTGGVYTGDEDNLEDFVDLIILTEEEQIEELNKRKDSVNYKNAVFQCNLCFKGFVDTEAWKHHLRKHDASSGPIECKICKFRFPDRRALQKHSINHEKKYFCKACSYCSKSVTQAKQHQGWHKGVTYSCQYCDEVLTKWTSYLSHVRMKHPSQHVCDVCGYSFVSELGLTMHKTMMHKDVEKEAQTDEELYCAECDVKFVTSEAYNRHKVTSVKHTAHFGLGCKVCGLTFPSREDLRLHHRRKHKRERPKIYVKKLSDKWPHKCEHCDEEISSAREHWGHYRRLHPDEAYPILKNYVCDVCGKSFRGNAFLKYHKRTHTDVRAYKCSICDKAFHNRSNLTMHARMHSTHRPHVCTVCNKGFKCKSGLDRHYRSHTGEKPYVCEVCGKGFGQSNSRNLHVKTVHLRQPTPYVSKTREHKRQNTATVAPSTYF